MNRSDLDVIKQFATLASVFEFKAVAHSGRSNTAAVTVRLVETPEFKALAKIANRLAWDDDNNNRWIKNDQ